MIDIKVAANETRKQMARSIWPKEKQHGNDSDQFDHIEWMLIGIETGYIQHEKAHRWLGWAQAMICTHQRVPLTRFRHINKGIPSIEQQIAEKIGAIKWIKGKK